jgi:hypothetical protein
METTHLGTLIGKDLPIDSYRHAHQVYRRFLEHFSSERTFQMHVHTVGIRTYRFFEKTHEVILSEREDERCLALAVLLRHNYATMVDFPEMYQGMTIGIIKRSDWEKMESEKRNQWAMPRII